jgi:hypothetical protein
MVAGSYDDWRAAHLLAEQPETNDTVREITTIGLPQVMPVSAQ